jgi:uncharacterized protein (TIGR03435 family)
MVNPFPFKSERTLVSIYRDLIRTWIELRYPPTRFNRTVVDRTEKASEKLMRYPFTATTPVLWLLSLTVIAVAQNQPLKFEVASVKLNPGCETRPRSGQSVTPARLNLECITLPELIENAYGVWANADRPSPKHLDVQGGSGWINSDHYAVVATASGNASRGQMNGPMLRALLEERFKLKVHREAKTVPVFALTLAKGQSKLKAAQPGRCVQSDPTEMPPAPVPGQPPPMVCGRPIPAPHNGNVMFDVFGVSLTDFADGLLSRIMDRIVIDRTGQAVLFDLHFEFTADGATPLGGQRPGPPTPPSGLSIFTALEEQLGLKLESTQAPVDVIVIDHAEKPSEN